MNHLSGDPHVAMLMTNDWNIRRMFGFLSGKHRPLDVCVQAHHAST